MRDIEKKWQEIWQKEKAFVVNIDQSKPKYYILEMLPYPSGKIHAGHLRNYSIGDVLARYMKAQGFNVLHPMGWDAFGLPAENAAVSNKFHPADWTNSNIKIMREQLKSLGLSYDWSREINTCNPDYYKHGQKFFLELYSKNLVYRKSSIVNWDPIDQTVLANEQVIDGKGWRSGANIEKRYLKQWFLKITNYAEELLDGLKHLTGWPKSVIGMQEKWIGKVEGISFKLLIKDYNNHIEVFLEKPESIFGATFIAIACNHPIIDQLVIKTVSIQDFISKCHNNNIEDKKGCNIDLYAIHPFDSSIHIPIIITNYTSLDYANGAVLCCPGHNKVDYELAINMNLIIKKIVASHINKGDSESYSDNDILINSTFLNNMTVKEARDKVITESEILNKGCYAIHYKLRDWGISRQRFWGCPIPVIHCNHCGIVTVPEQDLPVILPNDVDFNQKGNPLDNHPTWKYIRCPYCKNTAIRETDTFDTFFESSWYFLRYCNTRAHDMLDADACNYWLPVDQYIGGVEHAVMHLLYSRFFVKLMYEQKHLDIKEPFKNLLTQGMVLHNTYKDKDGKWLYPEEIVKYKDEFRHRKTNDLVIQGRIEKMSKSKNNVVDLNKILNDYGSDAIRLFILSDNPPEKDIEWSERGIIGCARFIQKLESTCNKINSLDVSYVMKERDKNLDHFISFTIDCVTNDIESFKLNSAIAKCRKLFNILLEKLNQHNVNIIELKNGFGILIRLLNPFIPHITEELWSKLSNNSKRLFEESWIKSDKNLSKIDNYMMIIQINGRVKTTHEFNNKIAEESIKSIVTQLPLIKKHLDGLEIKRFIIVPKKLINILV